MEPVSARKGLLKMVLASVFFSFMGAMINHAQLLEPASSPVVASFIRIVVNLAVVLGVAHGTGKLSELPGDMRWSLWGRGFFGALSLIFVVYAIRSIGVGETSFLHASNSVFIAALGPLVLKQRNAWWTWVAIGGAATGLALMLEPRFVDHSPHGRTVALLSGLWAAMAYLMIARAGRSNSSNTVIFYLCAVGGLLHLGIFAAAWTGHEIVPVNWPVNPDTWAWLAGAGIMASVAQYFLTAAYQTAPAALNAAVSYLTPVLNLAWSALVFLRPPDQHALAGAAMILICGVALPVAGVSAKKKTKQVAKPLNPSL
jgi:S-adenosylmethionine uptake transporter